MVEVEAVCTWDSSRDNLDLDAIQVGAAGQRGEGRRRGPEGEAEPPCGITELEWGAILCALASWPPVGGEIGLQRKWDAVASSE